MRERPWLVLVGGFLGAGKTTLILAAARELARRGMRSAAILNDQGADLVDTQMAQTSGIASDEVTGGCFCCRFSGLVSAAQRLREHRPDVIFAEPVGSCTDIVATTLLPLRAEYADEFRLAPFTVLIDPARAAELGAATADADLQYLFHRQIGEADLICLTKSDRGGAGPFAYEGLRVREISARTGQGVAAWLDEVMSGQLTAGEKTLDIDYEQYARVEAALAWLNLRAIYRPHEPVSPAMAIGPLLDGIDAGLRAANITAVHMKMTDDSSEGFLKAAICGNGQEPAIEGALDASPAARHEIRVNLRALGSPEAVRDIVEREIRRLPGDVSELHVACFSPAAPKPEKHVAPVR